MTVELAPGDKVISRKEAAEYLRKAGATISYQTLTIWAAREPYIGPPYFKDGHRAVYSIIELDLWWRTKRLRRVTHGQ